MKHITLDELRRMKDSEGLILQGCGGDLDGWVAGINELFTQGGILLGGDTFKDVAAFEHTGTTNLLFKMDGVDLHSGKLAMWRLRSHNTFGGTWLSDYLPNRLGVDMSVQTPPTRPPCPMIGADGNVFHQTGLVSRTLKENDMADAAKEMRERVMASGSYHEALVIMTEYVEPVQIGHAEGEPDFDMEM